MQISFFKLFFSTKTVIDWGAELHLLHWKQQKNAEKTEYKINLYCFNQFYF